MKKSNTVRRTNLANNSKTPASGAQSEQTKKIMTVSDKTHQLMGCFVVGNSLKEQILNALVSYYDNDLDVAEECFSDRFQSQLDEVTGEISNLLSCSIETNLIKTGNEI